MPAHIAVSVFELHLPGCRSLKEKRRVIKSLLERIHQRYRVSVTETDFHDLHQRCETTLAIVTTRERDAETILESIHRLVEQNPEAQLTSWEADIMGLTA